MREFERLVRVFAAGISGRHRGERPPPDADPRDGLVPPWRRTGLGFLITPDPDDPDGLRAVLRRAAEILLLETALAGPVARGESAVGRDGVPEGWAWLRCGVSDLLAGLVLGGGRPSMPWWGEDSLAIVDWTRLEDVLGVRDDRGLSRHSDRAAAPDLPPAIAERLGDEVRAHFAFWSSRLAHVLWSAEKHRPALIRAVRADLAGRAPEEVRELLPVLTDADARAVLEARVCPPWARDGLDFSPPETPLLPQPRGQVTGVDRDLNIVLVSLGKPDGIRPKSPLVILRDGVPIARLAVDKIGPDWACGHVDLGSTRDFPRKGDSARVGAR